jgi:hypothetical protein
MFRPPSVHSCTFGENPLPFAVQQFAKELTCEWLPWVRRTPGGREAQCRKKCQRTLITDYTSKKVTGAESPAGKLTSARSAWPLGTRF